jgi:hypothetical protein
MPTIDELPKGFPLIRLRRWLNALRELGVRVSTLRVDPPLDLQDTPGGPLLRLVEAPVRTARITGPAVSGKYPWQAVVAGSTGAWVDDIATNSGTTSDDPAYEFGGNAQVPGGSIVEMRRYAGEWRFQLGPCGASGATAPAPLGFVQRNFMAQQAGPPDPRLARGRGRGGRPSPTPR